MDGKSIKEFNKKKKRDVKIKKKGTNIGNNVMTELLNSLTKTREHYLKCIHKEQQIIEMGKYVRNLSKIRCDVLFPSINVD